MRPKAVFAVVGMAAWTVFAAPVIQDGNVSAKQDSSSRLVTINYKLENEPAVVTLDVMTNGVSIGLENVQRVAGDISVVVQPGDRTITWRPDLSWPGHVFKANEVSFKVKAWPLDAPPDYMVVDLVAPGPVLYYPDVAALPGGVTNRLYTTDYLLMRRIPAANVRWRMGSMATENNRHSSEPLHYVTLTDDYYMGVFELSLRQYHLAIDSGATDTDYNLTRPVMNVVYGDLRGTTTGPSLASLHEVGANSLLGKLRARTGVQFDLPTDAQWEYAYRAGSPAPCYDEQEVAGDAIAWTTANAGGAYKPCGLLKPNAWGLYDMAGNAWEWCLDEYNANPCAPNDAGTAMTDPVGQNNGSVNGIIRGGSYDNGNWDGRAARRETFARNSTYKTIGCRLCCPVRAPAGNEP